MIPISSSSSTSQKFKMETTSEEESRIRSSNSHPNESSTTLREQSQQETGDDSPEKQRRIPLGHHDLKPADVVGGHHGESAISKKQLKASPLTDGELFLKPLLKEREKIFYEEFLQETENDPHFARMVQDWIPTYHRTEKIGDIEYLVMQNLCSGFSKPCILDLKMGVRTYDDDASESKKAYEISKYPEQATQGFRITGFKQVVPKDVAKKKFDEKVIEDAIEIETEIIIKKTKKWRKDLHDPRKVRKVLKRFFNPYSDSSQDVWPLFEPKLREFLDVMKNQRSFRFIASSLLFIYEGDSEAASKTSLAVIDFAHVHPIRDEGGFDHGYVKGIETILRYMQQDEDEELLKTPSVTMD